MKFVLKHYKYGLPDSANRMNLGSFVLSRYQRIRRRTDGQTPAHNYVARCNSYAMLMRAKKRLVWCEQWRIVKYQRLEAACVDYHTKHASEVAKL